MKITVLAEQAVARPGVPWITTTDNERLSFAEAHADARLPRFAQPRFVELVAELPKTATGKVQRAVLRKRGSAAAWDRSRGG